MKLETADITDENIEKIGALFPNCLTEAKDEQGRLRRAIDFDKLRQELSHEVVEGADERYRFDWPEKRKATLLANTPTKMTLRPCREESVNFDTTQNLYIEGDNLEVLKLLRENYYKQVKMIYIDPPYNTGKDSFVYDDDFRKSTEEFSDESDATDEEGNKIFDIRQNNESNGRFHTDWLNMMYPRLKVAKDLLRDDGVIFISMGEEEIGNLKKLCQEIFGEDNLIENYIWESTFRPDNSSPIMRRNAEYVICFTRNTSMIERLVGEVKPREGLPSLTKSSMAASVLTFPAHTVKTSLKDGKYEHGAKDSYTLLDDVFVKNGIITNSFRLEGHVIWSQSNLEKEIAAGTEIIIKSDGFVPYTKKTGDSEMSPTKLIPNSVVGDVLAANAEIAQLFDKKVFSYPKPMSLVKYLAGYFKDKDFLVLDFFSGSATTAHAVMKLNAEDSGKRKFIMVQLRETCPEKSEAAKAGYKNICEIGKERIRRAGKKILEEVAAKNAEIAKKNMQGELELESGGGSAGRLALPDVGFRVLKLDSSNMKDVYYNPKEFEEEFVFHDSDASLAENIKPDRTGEDLLFDTMLRLGIPLSAKIAAEEIHGKKVFTVDDGLLMATFDKDLNEEAIAAIAKRKPVYFAMSDGGFATDNVADNFEQIWHEFSPDTKRKVI